MGVFSGNPPIDIEQYTMTTSNSREGKTTFKPYIVQKPSFRYTTFCRRIVDFCRNWFSFER